ncbi:unnamed protein product [Protopolystoma xenopodis]|uniref:Uncharacterized protein n=1 Tax=Protopolystoma xenopodis TaxID=117903 RepID=A0A3S5ARC4_9PLAT|nr:unnamed protein product [Protopolystoma xenopodis]
MPTRPADAGSARIELIDLSELAGHVVAEATDRMTVLEMVLEAQHGHQTKQVTIDDHPKALAPVAASVEIGGEFAVESAFTIDTEIAELNLGESSCLETIEAELSAIQNLCQTWGRSLGEEAGHPGPMDPRSTIKADVLARLADTTSAAAANEDTGLLLSYLGLLVKNNGNTPTSDIVSLLLDGHLPRSSDLRFRATVYGSPVPGRQVASPETFGIHCAGGYRSTLASLPPSAPTSGRQSPSDLRFLSSDAKQSITGANLNSLLRRAEANAIFGGSSLTTYPEDKTLDRFRQASSKVWALSILQLSKLF